MRILVVGGRWYGRITESVAKAAESLGHDVSVFGYRPWMSHDISVEGGRAHRLNARLMDALGKIRPDLTLLLKAEFVSPDVIRATRRFGSQVIAWWFDDPRPWRAYRPILSRLDHLFIFDTYYVGLLRPICRGRISYLPLGFDPDVYHPPRAPLRPVWNVTFAGTPYPGRIRFLERMRSRGLCIAGPGWIKSAPRLAKQVLQRRALSPRRTCALYWRSALVLNIHHPQSINGPNQRFFEVPGSGSVQLVDEKRELKSFFKPDREMVTFRTTDEAREKIDYYLSYPDERRRIGFLAARRAHEEHTYAHRLRDMFESLRL